MKNLFLPIAQACAQFGKAALVGFALVSVCASTATARANPAAPVSTTGLAGGSWKSPAEYAAVLAAERVFAAQKLAVPTIQPANQSVFTDYDRMLSYMQADLAANLPIEEIAFNNFKKVLGEHPVVPIPQNQAEGQLGILYATLVAKLTEP